MYTYRTVVLIPDTRRIQDGSGRAGARPDVGRTSLPPIEEPLLLKIPVVEAAD
jgi:hypothetical protein